MHHNWHLKKFFFLIEVLPIGVSALTVHQYDLKKILFFQVVIDPFVSGKVDHSVQAFYQRYPSRQPLLISGLADFVRG